MLSDDRLQYQPDQNQKFVVDRGNVDQYEPIFNLKNQKCSEHQYSMAICSQEENIIDMWIVIHNLPRFNLFCGLILD